MTTEERNKAIMAQFPANPDLGFLGMKIGEMDKEDLIKVVTWAYQQVDTCQERYYQAKTEALKWMKEVKQ